MQISALKNQKTSGGLGNFHVNDKENRGKIRTGTLYLVFRHLQRLNQGLTELGKQSQCNKSSFCLLARLQDLKDQCWSSQNQRHSFGNP